MKKIGKWGLVGVMFLALAFAMSSMTASAAGKEEKGSAKTLKIEKLVPIVNPTCPIMGTAMDKTAPENMTRMYNGQRIGFCCGECLTKWDAMSDKEKDVALKNAMKPARTKPAK